LRNVNKEHSEINGMEKPVRNERFPMTINHKSRNTNENSIRFLCFFSISIYVDRAAK